MLYRLEKTFLGIFIYKQSHTEEVFVFGSAFIYLKASDMHVSCIHMLFYFLRCFIIQIQNIRYMRCGRYKLEDKLKIYGFNNLTKSLSFNIYDVCYAKTPREQKDYIAYIDGQYNSERITNLMTNLTEMIGAKVLNVSKQDYDPQGASVTFLIAEESMIPMGGEAIVSHLDKSHVTVHTYPEYHPDTCIATFRVDVDVATCGEITPLSTLDYLIGSFDSDIITMDYRVRGFTRSVTGEKLFIDHNITSIQDYIDKGTLRRYDAVDINVYQANIFHTKMLIKELDLQNYLFNTDVYELQPQTRLDITSNLRVEMIEIFSGRNIY